MKLASHKTKLPDQHRHQLADHHLCSEQAEHVRKKDEKLEEAVHKGERGECISRDTSKTEIQRTVETRRLGAEVKSGR
jgi:hypothetical protein